MGGDDDGGVGVDGHAAHEADELSNLRAIILVPAKYVGGGVEGNQFRPNVTRCFSELVK